MHFMQAMHQASGALQHVILRRSQHFLSAWASEAEMPQALATGQESAGHACSSHLTEQHVAAHSDLFWHVAINVSGLLDPVPHVT